MAYTSVKISADSSSYQSQMKSAASQMKVLSAEYTTAATKAKLFGSETDSLKAKAESLTQKITVQKNIVQLNSEQQEKKYIERWIQRDKKNCKYVLKMDIRHFFESVDHDVLKAWLKKKIRDERMLYILELIIDGSEVGLPLGFYTSQWLSNFMLQPLDHFIKEQLKAVHYIRYMDDMVVFGKNKKELHRMQQEIERFLREKFNLQMKGNWQVFPTFIRGVDFLGYRTFYKYTLLRKTTCIDMTKKLTALRVKVESGNMMNYSEWCSINSYKGWLVSCDSFRLYQKYIEPLLPYADDYYKYNIKPKSKKGRKAA